VGLEHVLNREVRPSWRGGASLSGQPISWRGGALLHSPICTLVMVWGCGRGSSPYLTTWPPPSPPPSHMWCALFSTWCALPYWELHPKVYIIKHSLHCNLVGVGESCLWLYTIVILSFRIKRLWRSRNCVIHVCGCLMSFVLNL
jgi:hypothetical protein